MKKKCYIFGAGSKGKELLKYLNGLQDLEIVAFIDNDKAKWNTTIEGKQVINIEEAMSGGVQDEIVFISLLEYEKVEKQLKEKQFKKIYSMGRWLGKRLYFDPVILEESDYIDVRPFNHYESAYPDIVEIHKKEKELFDGNIEVLDINFNIDRQLELISKMEELESPQWSNVKDNSFRYFYDNAWFKKECADALYYLIRMLKPEKIIEVGSGYSTAVMLDTNENYCDNKISIISIEPRADRLKALLKPGDKIKIFEKNLQDIPVDFFEILEPNDILFIDSSHVSKMNSDVNYIFFEILPRIKSGVYIHFHDMMYPFIYPKKWIYSGVAYNEMYIMRAFLMNNNCYSIQLFGSMLSQKYDEKITGRLKGCGDGSLWIRKE